jgi:hypothetical protein
MILDEKKGSRWDLSNNAFPYINEQFKISFGIISILILYAIITYIQHIRTKEISMLWIIPFFLGITFFLINIILNILTINKERALTRNMKFCILKGSNNIIINKVEQALIEHGIPYYYKQPNELFPNNLIYRNFFNIRHLLIANNDPFFIIWYFHKDNSFYIFLKYTAVFEYLYTVLCPVEESG